MHKKGLGEVNYIVFLGVFMTFFTILSSIFATEIMTQKKESTSDLDKIVNTITDSVDWVGTNTLGRIPVVRQFWEIVSATIDIQYIHPYLGLLYLSFFGLPLGYLVLRLIRGGG